MTQLQKGKQTVRNVCCCRVHESFRKTFSVIIKLQSYLTLLPGTEFSLECICSYCWHYKKKNNVSPLDTEIYKKKRVFNVNQFHLKYVSFLLSSITKFPFSESQLIFLTDLKY